MSTTETLADLSETFTTNELARRWKCSPGHLANLRSAGTGPAYLKLFAGGKIVYRMQDVLAAENAALVVPEASVDRTRTGLRSAA